jgi:polysaccharide export outer membrane protein
MTHGLSWTKTGGALLALATLAGCTAAGGGGAGAGFGGTGTTIAQTGSLPAPQVLAATPNAAQVEYRVGPLDLLEIAVFQVPDLSKTVKVSASGEIGMPLIGTVQAGGKTVAELETEIKTKLEAKYLQSAQVSVFVKEATSQQVTVDGAVNSPGMVTLSGPTTLLQTIAMSGGLTKNASPRGIVVFRTVDQKRLAAKFDLTAIRGGRSPDPVLYGGDIVVVDSSALGTALGGIRESIPAFAVFTPLLL